MKVHKDIKIRVDAADKKIFVDGVFLEAMVCLYSIEGEAIESIVVEKLPVSFEMPVAGKYMFVITHALYTPTVKMFTIE